MRNCNCNCNSNSNFFMNNTNSNIYDNSFSQSTAFPTNYLCGHAYTPVQNMNKTYTPEAGLQNGTIYPELVSPYFPGQSIDFINYLKNGGTRI